MKRVLYAAVIAMGCTIAVGAQGTAASKEKMAKEPAKTVAVTGCVAESEGHYMLNNATVADQAGAPMSYALTGGTLKPHVGHKVEITGTIKPAAKDTMKKDTMSKDTMSKDKMATAGTLAVTSLKMIAPSCS
jgi:tRNA A37 methylthiotransferase MiaB